MGGTGEEAAFGGVPELTRINAITTATAATTLPIIVQKSVRPRCIGPPRRSCLSLGNVASSHLVALADPDSHRFWTVAPSDGLSLAISLRSSLDLSCAQQSGR